MRDDSFLSVAKAIEQITGESFVIKNVQPVSGGDINAAFCLIGDKQRFFVKCNQADKLDMFAAEFEGLQALAQTKTVRVPNPIVFDADNQRSFLVLEWIEFGKNSHSMRFLGQQLAQLHQQKQPYFGWHRNNTIGSTPQINHQNENWVEFWQQQRLGFQLQLAAKNGFGGRLQKLGEKLLSQCAVFFANYQPKPALLHGDLWGGNWATDTNGNPVIFDPACYFGDRETDLAMTELFGGFGRDFYAAYNEIYSLDVGYSVRKNFYNLYHILNHVNLFGGGYAKQAENIIEKLLAEI